MPGEEAPNKEDDGSLVEEYRDLQTKLYGPLDYAKLHMSRKQLDDCAARRDELRRILGEATKEIDKELVAHWEKMPQKPLRALFEKGN